MGRFAQLIPAVPRFMLGKISCLGNALSKQQAHIKLLSFTAYAVFPLSKEAVKRKPCDGRSDLHGLEQRGAVAAALDTGICRPAEGCSGIAPRGALLLSRRTGTHQSPSYSVLVPSCDTAGK